MSEFIPSTIKTNTTKTTDAGYMNEYLRNHSRKELSRFITKVMALTDYPRKRFFNWRYLGSRIPEDAKDAVEKVIGFPIFPRNNFDPSCQESLKAASNE